MEVFGDESSFSRNRTIHKYPLHRNSQVLKPLVCATQIYLACGSLDKECRLLRFGLGEKSIANLYASRDTMRGAWQTPTLALSPQHAR